MRIFIFAACVSLLSACSTTNASDATAAAPPARCSFWTFVSEGGECPPAGGGQGAVLDNVGVADPTAPPTNIGTASSGNGSSWWPFGGGDEAAEDVPQLGVNAYLWRATLDTLNFMPLASGDPVGGVIITDWYSSQGSPNERMKVTAYILDRRLRADALNVSVFRQMRTADGWADAPTNPDTAVRLENAILTRARELHISLVQ